MPADELFEDVRLASLYDPFNGWDVCDAFYFDLTREIGGTVLDLGCGTGLLACRIPSEDQIASANGLRTRSPEHGFRPQGASGHTPR